MPVYEYECPNDGTIRNIIEPINTKHRPLMCDLCGAIMKRVWSPVAVAFKGEGWGGSKK